MSHVIIHIITSRLYLSLHPSLSARHIQVLSCFTPGSPGSHTLGSWLLHFLSVELLLRFQEPTVRPLPPGSTPRLPSVKTTGSSVLPRQPVYTSIHQILLLCNKISWRLNMCLRPWLLIFSRVEALLTRGPSQWGAQCSAHRGCSTCCLVSSVASYTCWVRDQQCQRERGTD